MVEKKSTNTTSKTKSPATSRRVATKPKSNNPGWRSRRLKDVYYAVWSAVGVILIVLAAVAVFGSGTWVENLNVTEVSQSPGQSAQQPQQPPQPSQEELDCVMDGVGEERFVELQQGGQPDPEESAVIEECLEF